MAKSGAAAVSFARVRHAFAKGQGGGPSRYVGPEMDNAGSGNPALDLIAVLVGVTGL